MNNKPVLRADKIRNFAISMILDAFVISNKDKAELRNKLRKAILQVLAIVFEIDSYSENHVKTGIEGIIEGVVVRRRGSIDVLQSQSDFLQARLNAEKQELEDEISVVVEELKDVAKNQTDDIQQIIEKVITDINIM